MPLSRLVLISKCLWIQASICVLLRDPACQRVLRHQGDTRSLVIREGSQIYPLISTYWEIKPYVRSPQWSPSGQLIFWPKPSSREWKNDGKERGETTDVAAEWLERWCIVALFLQTVFSDGWQGNFRNWSLRKDRCCRYFVDSGLTPFVFRIPYQFYYFKIQQECWI